MTFGFVQDLFFCLLFIQVYYKPLENAPEPEIYYKPLPEAEASAPEVYYKPVPSDYQPTQ
jgi:hypothetical protein